MPAWLCSPPTCSALCTSSDTLKASRASKRDSRRGAAPSVFHCTSWHLLTQFASRLSYRYLKTRRPAIFTFHYLQGSPRTG